jgi:shikimate kinase
VKTVLRRFGLLDTYGAYVETDSNIPIARGLKSSSTAANALTLACLSALGEECEDLEVVKLGVEAAMEAKVTITGAFDDACASYFGDIVVTDNLERRILRRFIPEDLSVLLYVPSEKSYTVKADLQRMRLLAREVDVAFKEALSGNYWTAMTLNGLIYASALGYDPSIALDALAKGAIAAGLSGKGPSFAAVVPRDSMDNVKEAWKSLPGKLIETSINHEKARRLP